jgi:hypothetical protein
MSTGDDRVLQRRAFAEGIARIGEPVPGGGMTGIWETETVQGKEENDRGLGFWQAQPPARGC